MTDAEKCRLIAGFEFPNGFEDSYSEENRDYPHDLNATMRAARRLPKSSLKLDIAYSVGRALCRDDDPARAAFEALAAYLMERQK